MAPRIPYHLAIANLINLFLPITRAMVSTGRAGSGFVGYGIQMYPPACAYACKDSISAPLNCSTTTSGDGTGMDDMSGMDSSGEDMLSGDGWMIMSATPACMAESDFYLKTLAYCVKQHCQDVPLDKLEHFWLHDSTGRETNPPVPVLSYSEALAAITDAPTQELNNSIFLNYIALVTKNQWTSTYNAETNFDRTEITHARYGLVLIITGAVIPIGLSGLRFLPWPAWLIARFYGFFIDPPLFGAKHDTPVRGLGIMPSRGQALFIAYLWIMNVVLSAAGYEIIWPHNWWVDKKVEVLTYVSNRTGVLSFANLPLVMLYAGRNNVLLWLTNWRHETFLMLHRWVAFICMLQAVIHSAIYLKLYTTVSGYDHATESRLAYWYWGVIATLCLVVLIPLSIQPLRQKVYEAFLASHIVLSILAMIGCFLHIWYRFAVQWGYETWLYMAAAIWAFDRVIRIVRFLRLGVKRAFVTDIDGDYYRVDIPGLAATGHVYLHFPTLSTWRIWENHPFSVAGVTGASFSTPPAAVDTLSKTGEKNTLVAEASRSISPPLTRKEEPYYLKTTIFIRRNSGFTSLLATAGSGPKGIPVLVEGFYGHGMTFLQGEEVAPTPEFPSILCIVGGVGITAILPILSRTSAICPQGNTKLLWGVRSMPLVHAVEDMLCVPERAGTEQRRWGSVDVTLSVGERFAFRSLLESELRSRRGGTTVVVCGPPEMADEIRCIVSGLCRHANSHSVVARLVVESFSW